MSSSNTDATRTPMSMETQPEATTTVSATNSVETPASPPDDSARAVPSDSATAHLQSSFEIIKRALPGHSFALYWIDEETQLLKPYMSDDLELATPDRRDWTIPVGQGIVGHVIRTGRAEFVNNAHLDPRSYYPPDLKVEREHLVCVPLRLGEHIVGAFVISRSSHAPFSVQEFNLAQLYVQYIALAVEHAQLTEKYHQTSITDALTNVYNRRHILAVAATEWFRALRNRFQISVALVYPERLQRLRETYGEVIHNEALIIVGKSCQGVLRTYDSIGRYNADEFIILLPHTDPLSATTVAERLQRGMANKSVATPDGPFRLTISIGVATMTRSTNDLAALITQAELALTEAKTSGFGRVVAH